MTQNLPTKSPRVKTALTHEYLLSVLHYDPLTGIFTYLKRVHSCRGVGDEAGSQCKRYGYVKIQLLGVVYPAHRLAWFYMTGAWPEFTVDHRDTDKKNNRWENLRDVPHAHNMHNQTKAHKQNKTGFIGVQLIKGKYTAVLNVKGVKKKHFGTFKTPEEASKAYHQAKAIHCPGYIKPEE